MVQKVTEHYKRNFVLLFCVGTVQLDQEIHNSALLYRDLRCSLIHHIWKCK